MHTTQQQRGGRRHGKPQPHSRQGTAQVEAPPPGGAGSHPPASREAGVPRARRHISDALVLGDNGWVLPFSRVWEFSLMDSEGNMRSKVERDRADAE